MDDLVDEWAHRLLRRHAALSRDEQLEVPVELSTDDVGPLLTELVRWCGALIGAVAAASGAPTPVVVETTAAVLASSKSPPHLTIVPPDTD